MKHDLSDFIKGWFIGDFEPTLVKTTQFEVGVKNYKKGDFEVKHFHKVATEYTVIVSGRCIMLGQEFGPNEIVQINPGIATSFEALEDVVTLVVKIPSLPNDKFNSLED